MRAGKTVSIPLGMVFRRHYCHKCGARLEKNPIRRLISPNDPDWNEHSRIGSAHMLKIGEIEATEYNFKCPDCGNTIEYKSQTVIRNIQKRLKKKQLTVGELDEHTEWSRLKIHRTKKLWKAAILISITIFVLLIAWSIII